MSVVPQGVMLPSNSGSTANGIQQIIPQPHYIMFESLMSGIREDGKMSLIRRFFCLFVAFDLLFTILLWFISVVVHGGDIFKSMSNEVYNYSVRTSLFDVVICAALRFTILLIIYGLLYVSHLFLILITASGTNAFLVGKVFFYNWTSSSQPLLQAIIIMSSFVIAWIEVWFMGLKVLPQEQYARKYLSVNQQTTEQTPLLLSQTSVDASDSSSQQFYSPIATPEGSDTSTSDEDEEILPKRTLQEIKENYLTCFSHEVCTGKFIFRIRYDSPESVDKKRRK